MIAFDLTTAEGRVGFDAHRWAFEDRWSAPVLARAVGERWSINEALHLTIVQEWGDDRGLWYHGPGQNVRPLHEPDQREAA